jgi:hypothetical protein
MKSIKSVVLLDMQSPVASNKIIYYCAYTSLTIHQMAEKINMRSNYPVLKGQGIELQGYLAEFYRTFDNWFRLNPFDGILTDRQIAANWISGEGEPIAVERLAIASGGHHACLLIIIAEIAKLMNVNLFPVNATSTECGLMLWPQ